MSVAILNEASDSNLNRRVFIRIFRDRGLESNPCLFYDQDYNIGHNAAGGNSIGDRPLPRDSSEQVWQRSSGAVSWA